MGYKKKVGSIKKFKLFNMVTSLIILSLTIIIITSSLYISFKKYDETKYNLQVKDLRARFNVVMSEYVYRVLAISSQPIFYNSLNYLSKESKFDELRESGMKRQIGQFTAPRNLSTFFEGSIVKSIKNQVIISQGDVLSDFHIKILLCYRDSAISFDSGSPCLGSWKLYINKHKLYTLLKKNGFSLSENEKNNLPIKDFLKFKKFKVVSSKLPNDIFVSLKKDINNFKYYIIIGVFTSFILLLIIFYIINRRYLILYINPIQKIHQNLINHTFININEFNQCESEILSFIEAINSKIDQAKVEALSHLAHDIKQPLRRIQHIALELTDKHKQSLLDIHTQISLSTLQVHSYDKEQLDLKKVVMDCVFSFYREYFDKGVITIESIDKVFSFASYTHILRVISNLIDNSIKAVSHLKNPLISILIRKIDNNNYIKISDNGIGMSSEKIRVIFQPGVSYSNSSGQGLYYCLKMIKEFKGDLSCKSIENCGTNFQIKLPQCTSPFYYIDSLFYKKKSVFIIIDDEINFYFNVKNRLINNVCIHLETEKEVSDFFKQTHELSPFIFIVDFDFSPQINGVNIINQYGLLGQAYLFSSTAELVRNQYTHLLNELPILSKNYFRYINTIDITNFKMIVVDDDPEILEDFILINNNLLALDNFLQLKMVTPLLCFSTPITLDNRVKGTQIKGFDIAKELIKKGFTRVAMQTGDVFNNCPNELTTLPKGTILNE